MKQGKWEKHERDFLIAFREELEKGNIEYLILNMPDISDFEDVLLAALVMVGKEADPAVLRIEEDSDGLLGLRLKGVLLATGFSVEELQEDLKTACGLPEDFIIKIIKKIAHPIVDWGLPDLPFN